MENKTWSEIVAQYKTLSESEKESVTHFFNMHNFCAWLYECMSPEAKQYCDACIQASTTVVDDVEPSNV